MSKFHKILSVLIYLPLLFLSSCLGGGSKTKIKVAGRYVASDPETSQEIQKWINELTSPNFFTYTRAAKNLIDRKHEAIPALYANINLTRECNGTEILVCLQVIQTIFEKSSVDWVKSQVKHDLPEIAQLANQELQRRESLANSSKTK